jgi:ParB family chromosome partitioning protein
MSKSIEEGLRQPDLQIENLPIESVQPDPANPNELPDDLLDTLKQDVRERGFVQPVLVRPLEGEEERYQIIDGEHRWKVLLELGAETVPAVVEDVSEDDARLRNITMNRLRGSFVPIKLALLLADLNQRIPEDELRRRLGMDEAELKDSLRLAEFTDELPDKVREATEREEKEAPEVLQFVLTKRDAKVVERVIGKLTNETTDRAKALVQLCREYEKSGSG